MVIFDNYFEKNHYLLFNAVFNVSRYQLIILIFSRDTAGKSRFESLGEMFLSEAMGVVFCFDISDRKSFSNLPHWMNKFIGNTLYVATKKKHPNIDIK